MSIDSNIKQIRSEIAEAAISTGRKPKDITLVAASKTKPADLIKQAILAGVDAVGENRVQEMLVKKEQGAYNGAPLHFIGNLQSNKISKVVGVCDLIESVSSESLITAIGRKAEALEIVQNVLIEINIGKEPQKQGILPENINRALDLVSQTKGIKVLGLMTIPPIFNKIERNCNYFDIMYQLFVDIRAKNSDNVLVQFLSMGMSDTYIEAIRAGSNMVRVGTAIFGER